MLESSVLREQQWMPEVNKEQQWMPPVNKEQQWMPEVKQCSYFKWYVISTKKKKKRIIVQNSLETALDPFYAQLRAVLLESRPVTMISDNTKHTKKSYLRK
jgi:hypothetical protein